MRAPMGGSRAALALGRSDWYCLYVKRSTYNVVILFTLNLQCYRFVYMSFVTNLGIVCVCVKPFSQLFSPVRVPTHHDPRMS
jgi:hypothetical protein